MNDNDPGKTPRHEKLVCEVLTDFTMLAEQITTGLQVVLESRDVPKATRVAVADYMADVTADLWRIEAGVGKLCELPGAPEAGYARNSGPVPHPDYRTLTPMPDFEPEKG